MASIEDVIETKVRVAVRESVGEALQKLLEEIRPKTSAGDLMPVAEAAGILDVDEKTIRRWLKAGKLKTYHAGREKRISRIELDAFSKRAPDSESGELTPEAAAAAILNKRGG